MPDNSSGIIETDIVIAGAGPAGCAAALALNRSGKRVLLLDKALFPREKTCGDSVPSSSLLNLESVSPGIYDRFLQTVRHNSFRSSSLVFPDGSRFTVDWPLPGYLVYRRDFDAFLLDHVRRSTGTRIITGLRVSDYECHGNFFRLTTVTPPGIPGAGILCSCVIGADGAPSLAARQLAGYEPDQKTYGQAVRCYFTNVSGMDPDVPLVFTHPDFFPGYFWLFPMADGQVNAGYGMPEKRRKKSAVPLHGMFYRFTEQHPVVRQMLSGARRVTPLRGGMIPFAMKRQPWSGPGFYLAGDAASLVDPLSGDGIQFAVKSGLLAGAMAAKDSGLEGPAGSGNGLEYDRSIRLYIWNRMRSRRNIIRFLEFAPGLLRLVQPLGRFGWFRNRIRKWI